MTSIPLPSDPDDVQPDAHLGGVRGPAYATVPEWVLYSDVSANAVRLYATLTRYVGLNEAGWPSRKTLAGRTHLSPTTVDRALQELVDLGALHIEPRYRSDGSQTSSLYYLTTPDATTEATPAHERPPPSPRATSLEVTPRRPNPNDRTPTNARDTDAAFDAAWEHYPRKLNRKGALKAWKAQVSKGASVDDLTTAALHYASGVRGKDPGYIMHGSTFYGPNDRWRDYLAGTVVDTTGQPAGLGFMLGKIQEARHGD